MTDLQHVCVKPEAFFTVKLQMHDIDEALSQIVNLQYCQ